MLIIHFQALSDIYFSFVQLLLQTYST